MPIDRTHQHVSSDIMQVTSVHEPISPGGGGSISATDGTTTVDPATSLSFPAGTLTAPGGGVAGVQLPVLVATTRVTPAELVNLTNVPVDLVPAQGAGTIILPLAWIARVEYVTTPYTTADTLLYLSWDFAVAATAYFGTALLGSTQSAIGFGTLASPTSASFLTAVANKPIQLTNDGPDLADGDSDLVISVAYFVVDANP